MLPWIKATDKKPLIGEEVLVYETKMDSVRVLVYYGEENAGRWDNSEVTHWIAFHNIPKPVDS